MEPGSSVDLAGLLWGISCPIVGAVMDILTRQVVKCWIDNQFDNERVTATVSDGMIQLCENDICLTTLITTSCRRLMSTSLYLFSGLGLGASVFPQVLIPNWFHTQLSIHTNLTFHIQVTSLLQAALPTKVWHHFRFCPFHLNKKHLSSMISKPTRVIEIPLMLFVTKLENAKRGMWKMVNSDLKSSCHS